MYKRRLHPSDRNAARSHLVGDVAGFWRIHHGRMSSRLQSEGQIPDDGDGSAALGEDGVRDEDAPIRQKSPAPLKRFDPRVVLDVINVQTE